MILRGSLLLFYMIRRSMMNPLPKSRMVPCTHKPYWGCFGWELMVVVVEEEKKVESRVHKSLAEMLGIPKRGEVVEQKKVAVVIDPKLTKVLRPHQIEGVKVPSHSSIPLMLVSLPCNDRKNPRRSIRMYHGRRNGSRKNCTPPTTES